MSRFAKGWVSINRKILWPLKQENEFYGDGNLAAIWILLIAWANVRDGKTKTGKDGIIVKRGQLITSQSELAQQIGVSRQVVRRCLSYLEKTGKINQQTNRNGTIITVCKYGKYQSAENIQTNDTTNYEPITNQLRTNYEPPIEQGNNETRKQGNKEEDVAASAPTPPKWSEWDLETASILKAKIVTSNPDAKKIKTADPKKWANHFRLMRESDGIKEERIREVLDWLFEGCWYATNVQSAKKFRDKWDYVTGLMNERKNQKKNPDPKRAEKDKILDGIF